MATFVHDTSSQMNESFRKLCIIQMAIFTDNRCATTSYILCCFDISLKGKDNAAMCHSMVDSFHYVVGWPSCSPNFTPYGVFLFEGI